MPNVVLVFIGVTISVLGVYILRDLIESVADKYLPYYVTPWQNVGLQIVLWLVVGLFWSAFLFCFLQPNWALLK